ncbi:hypothetical protein [Longimicrobium sp.]|jgi:hypothetical protein|uniref:hypothetical protein n=1 Tax=Longimicrobium sp. TaxID=2029185 RepID=UPI002ED8E566
MIRVTLDIFSGRPNPTWEVDTPSTTTDLVRTLESASEIMSDAESVSARLGFRGILVEETGAERPLTARNLPKQFRLSGDDRSGVDLALRLIDQLGDPAVEPRAELTQPVPPVTAEHLRQLIKEDVTRHRGGSPPRGGVRGFQAAAPVLGTDATTWTTQPQGACQIEIASFNPGFWNVSPVVANNNCYNYATNRRTDTFAQPGRSNGKQTATMVCSNVQTAAKSDGVLPSSMCLANNLQPRWYVALVIWPGVDYHWYRQQAGGIWGHKPGSTPATNSDNSGNVITNPQTANRGGYTSFCGYFFVGSNVQIA